MRNAMFVQIENNLYPVTFRNLRHVLFLPTFAFVSPKSSSGIKYHGADRRISMLDCQCAALTNVIVFLFSLLKWLEPNPRQWLIHALSIAVTISSSYARCRMRVSI